MTNLDIFGTEFKSNIIIFKKKHPRNCLIANFCARIKYLNLGSKVLYLDISGLEFEKDIVIFRISSLEFF